MCIKKCIYCGAKAQIKKIEDMYYVQCSKCNRHGQYSYVGRFEKYAIAQWNMANIPSNNGMRVQIGEPRKHKVYYRYVYTLDGVPGKSLVDIAGEIGFTESYLRTLFANTKGTTIEIHGHIITKRRKHEQ